MIYLCHSFFGKSKSQISKGGEDCNLIQIQREKGKTLISGEQRFENMPLW